MNASYFLDTNIIIYAVEGNPPAKAEIARVLVSEAIAEGIGVISYQVVQECLHAVTGKARIALTPKSALGSSARHADAVVQGVSQLNSFL